MVAPSTASAKSDARARRASRAMLVIPCALCGYDAPLAACPHCGGAAEEPTLSGAGRAGSDVRAGLVALARGLGFLATTRGTKRWLVPPFVLTTLAFGFVLSWAWNRFESLLERARSTAEDAGAPDLAWFERLVQVVVESTWFVVLAKLGAGFLFLVVGFFAALYMFSLFYEAISGPFLDTVQGRIEERWFGVDPRDALERPAGITAARCAAFSALAAAVALLAAWLAWRYLPGNRWWAVPAAALAPFLALSAAQPAYGRWLGWALRVEAGTLWTSVRTSLIALCLLVLCLPLKLVPFAGPVLFAAAAGFTTAISLLDIPFSRRRWTLGQRLAFLSHHAAPLVAFGTVASLLFLIPFAGPILMVPGASIGGLWLLVRLDKSALRLKSARRAARTGGAA